MIIDSFVLDSSVTISWFIPDEVTSNNSNTLEMVTEKNIIVPSIWSLEVGNVLLAAERRKRITSEQRYSAVHALNELSIEVDPFTFKHAWQETMKLAELHDLSLYDASYLELALRMNIPIVTFDNQLKKAAKSRNIIIITEPHLED